MELEIKGLSVQAGEKKILNDIYMRCKGNQIVGVIGPNGCGKTTLLKYIYRDLTTRNKVFLDHIDVSELTRKELAKKVSVLAQKNNLADGNLTVGEIVRMGRYPYKELFEQYNDSDEVLVDSVLQKNGLSALKERKLSSMSGGEAQRAMLSKAIVQQTDMLILDEPTNHLDVKYQVELMNLLKDFLGLVIVSLHDLNLAANYCDYLYVLKDGKLFGQGTPEEICKDVLLSNLFEVPFKVLRTSQFIIYVQPSKE